MSNEEGGVLYIAPTCTQIEFTVDSAILDMSLTEVYMSNLAKRSIIKVDKSIMYVG